MGDLTRGEWTLLVLASAPNHEVDKLQLQKSLFILGKWIPEVVGSDFFAFEPYSYGPFTKDVYVEAESLVEQKFALQAGNAFFATLSGRQQAEALPIAPEVRQVLGRVVEWVRGRTFEQLCQDVYVAFPEMRRRSVLPVPQKLEAERAPSLAEWFAALPPEKHESLKKMAAIAREADGDPMTEQALVGASRKH